MPPQILVIIDGLGYSKKRKYNAWYCANPKNLNNWFKNFPHTLLHASGKYVGLLPNMIGNSEVGHMCIGSGRIIKQPVAVITQSIKNNEFFNNPILTKRLSELNKSGGTLHLMGLLSDAGVHSMESHLIALIKMALDYKIKKIVIHAFTDGRDVPPMSAKKYLNRLDKLIKKYPQVILGSIHGRFYAMDRDHHWDRTQKSYDVLIQKSIDSANWKDLLKKSYKNGITDEFIVPRQLTSDANIGKNDGIIFFNFRADRARQLTSALADTNFNYFKTSKTGAWLITMTDYLQALPIEPIYKQLVVSQTFFDILEENKKRIFTIAETEKYAHVTYFFNGLREIIRRLETRILIPSLRKNSSYKDTPCMSAQGITDKVIESLLTDPHDFYLINYANPDMVGHSGDFIATCKAIKCLDTQLGRLFDIIVKKLNGILYITSDHGKAEDMYDINTKQPRTAHTNNKVPFIMIGNKLEKNKVKKIKQLADIAPFILQNLNLPIPDAMK